MGKRLFSDAEVEACIQIVRRYGEVSYACWQECKAKLGRSVTKRMLLIWYRESLGINTKKQTSRREKSLTEATPVSGIIETNESNPNSVPEPPVDLSGMSSKDMHKLLGNFLYERAFEPDQIKMLNGKGLFDTIAKWHAANVEMERLEVQKLMLIQQDPNLVAAINRFIEATDSLHYNKLDVFNAYAKFYEEKYQERQAKIEAPANEPSAGLADE